MSAVLVAAGIGAAASIYDSYNASNDAKKARESQERIAEQQVGLARDQLEFSQEQFDMWTDTYGDIEKTMSAHYNNLTPDSYERQAVTNLQSAYQTRAKQLRESQAQSGLTGSGIQARSQNDLSMEVARQEATIRTQAPDIVNQQKQSFLSAGLSQKSNLANSVLNSTGNVSNALGQQGNMYANDFSFAKQQEAQASQSLGQIAGQVSQYYGQQNTNPTQAITQPAGPTTMSPGTRQLINRVIGSGTQPSVGAFSTPPLYSEGFRKKGIK